MKMSLEAIKVYEALNTYLTLDTSIDSSSMSWYDQTHNLKIDNAHVRLWYKEFTLFVPYTIVKAYYEHTRLAK